jgi:Prokaryotic cytochrome b561
VQHPGYSKDGTMTDATITPAYTITARVLHWITAFLILSMIPLGVVIANEWGGSMQESLYDLHRSIGATIIPLVILRLIYRWMHPPLPLPDDIPALQALAAHVTHWGLYALLIVQPLTGWLATSAYRAPVTGPRDLQNPIGQPVYTVGRYQRRRRPPVVDQLSFARKPLSRPPLSREYSVPM